MSFFFFSWVGLGEASQNRRTRKCGVEGPCFLSKVTFRKGGHFIASRVFKMHSDLRWSVMNIFVHFMDMNTSTVFALFSVRGKVSMMIFFYDFWLFTLLWVSWFALPWPAQQRYQWTQWGDSFNCSCNADKVKDLVIVLEVLIMCLLFSS